VTKLGATGTANSSFLPEVGYAIRRKTNDFGRFGTAKTLASIFKYSNLDVLAWQNVRNENHATLVACHENTAVRHLLNIYFEGTAYP
jgi:hypothetical protein